MSVYAHRVMIAFSLFIGLFSAIFIFWLLYALLASFRDWLTQRRVMKARRIRNQDMNRAYSHGQFSVPKQMRDFK